MLHAFAWSQAHEHFVHIKVGTSTKTVVLLRPDIHCKQS